MPITPVRTITSKVWGLSFDGVDDYVDIPDSLPLNPDAYTIEILARCDGPNSPNTFQQLVDLRGERATFIDLDISLRLRFRIYDGTTTYDLYANTIDYDVFYHIVALFDGAYMHMYINGTEATTPISANPPTTAANNSLVGKDYNLAADRGWWNGIIVFVRIYNRALSEDEILDNYRGYVTTDGLVLWLWANELLASGSVWRDRSGYGNHATIYGAGWVETPRIEFAKPTRLIAQTRLISPTR